MASLCPASVGLFFARPIRPGRSAAIDVVNFSGTRNDALGKNNWLKRLEKKKKRAAVSSLPNRDND